MSGTLSRTTDFLVIGGGIVGICVARALRGRWPEASVSLLEKEGACGRHASGRNSGVLHAGFYYDADSLKARFTREGNERLVRYCVERELPIDRCGKLVVARTPTDLAGLDELARRGELNGVELHSVSEREASDIEPLARTLDRALYSPRTAVVDPGAVVASLASDARNDGVEFATSRRYTGREGHAVLTDAGRCSPGYVVNCAGLQADRVAHDFGFGLPYRILPFRGTYLVNRSGPQLRTNVYPVPDPAYPFLGVHLTPSVGGDTRIGPTAAPALWREHYGGLSDFRLEDALEIVPTEARMLLADTGGFRRLALQALRRQSRSALLRLAGTLVPDVASRTGWTWGVPGIRAQLQQASTRELVSDFVVEGDDRSFHVLNAVSPAFTCALPFADFVVEEIALRTGNPVSSGAAAVGSSTA